MQNFNNHTEINNLHLFNYLGMGTIEDVICDTNFFTLGITDPILSEDNDNFTDYFILKYSGFVTKVGDGVATVNGLYDVQFGELVEILINDLEDTTKSLNGIILDLKENEVGVVILGEDSLVKEGTEVIRTELFPSINVGFNLLGKVINPVGEIVEDTYILNSLFGVNTIINTDNNNTIITEEILNSISNIDDILYNDELFSNYIVNGVKSSDIISQYIFEKFHVEKNVEVKGPDIISRESVTEPLETGLKVIDALIPIGKGQRELIIGDRQTGKTTIAVDAILQQKYATKYSSRFGVYCIYVAIGQKQSNVFQVYDTLNKYNALNYSILVIANASDSAALQYLAPYAGSAVGEYFRDNEMDSLIIFDDLSKQAVAYRQISLLLKRAPSRDAYPGDVFYIHSRLLERAAKLSIKLGAGSLTALPIIETQAGDVSAYIPTNVISITDGQIFLETTLFYMGIRPALNPGLSVSRVGAQAQNRLIRRLAGSLKLELAQYREVVNFARFGADIDDATQQLINRGERLTEILKQDSNSPLSVSLQVLSFYSAVGGYLDSISLNNIVEYEDLLHKFYLNFICKNNQHSLFLYNFFIKDTESLYFNYSDIIININNNAFNYNDILNVNYFDSDNNNLFNLQQIEASNIEGESNVLNDMSSDIDNIFMDMIDNTTSNTLKIYLEYNHEIFEGILNSEYAFKLLLTDLEDSIKHTSNYTIFNILNFLKTLDYLIPYKIRNNFLNYNIIKYVFEDLIINPNFGLFQTKDDNEDIEISTIEIICCLFHYYYSNIKINKFLI
jgi:proton translocating ATP synthase F1 alpha subunit